MKNNNTNRFSDRVADYIKYRPAYPTKIIHLLEAEIGLTKNKIIADIGSGTGLSSILFLNNGNAVYGIEPNKEMRVAQEHLLKDFAKFKSIEGTAEQSTLSDHSVDMIFSGQAFHWFDKKQSKIEFSRILKDGGNIVLVWNSRSNKSDFQKEYEEILCNRIEEYKNVNHRNIKEEDISNFFFPKIMKQATFDNEQIFGLEELKGRLKSSSYSPKEGIVYESLMSDIDNLFRKYQNLNRIKFTYETMVYWC